MSESPLTEREAEALRIADMIVTTPAERLELLAFLGWPGDLPHGRGARTRAVVEIVAARAKAEAADLRAKLGALADEWEAVALRLSPGSLTAGVRQNGAADLRAALTPTTSAEATVAAHTTDRSES